VTSKHIIDIFIKYSINICTN